MPSPQHPYRIRAKDPSGEFVKAIWTTEWLPRIGDQVALPESIDMTMAEWQELTVTEIVHYPGEAEVWLGGTDGWEPGSVARLFETARSAHG